MVTNKILCSTGALLGNSNNIDYKLLKKISSKLECDGFEFMVYSSWYPEIDELISCVRSMNLNIPVIHCQKSLGEKLSGIKVWRKDGKYPKYRMTEEQDRKTYWQALDEFSVNLKVAKAFGAKKMVLHLWNGLTSDKNIEKNIERFGRLDDMAKQAGIQLLVENVICNTRDPLYNMGLLRRTYPNVDFVYDTKMAEFHGQTMKIFEPEWEWILKEGHIKHLHVNDYGGGYKDWRNLKVLPIGKGHVDFDDFFSKLSQYGYDGDYTVEATGLDRKTGNINFDMLNECFENLRKLRNDNGI